MKILWHWFTMGPYHFARMSAVARRLDGELVVVETTSSDDHNWHRDQRCESFRHVTLSKFSISRRVHKSVRNTYLNTLTDFVPDLVVESGYANTYSLHSLLQYQRVRPDLPAILWSETTERDHKRNGFLEAIKRSVVSVFAGAIVAGTPHAAYMENLGIDRKLIGVVGNSVDNEFFGNRADDARAKGLRPDAPWSRKSYFLFVGRFIPEKNLPLLIRAYHRYRQFCADRFLDLVLVGAGPEEEALRAQVTALSLDGVHFEGSRQADEITSYYAFASCLVLPSVSEPWGLVVNEAMASGIPVLASAQCGCVEDLVTPGETGYVFDSHDEGQLAERLLAIGASPEENAIMGQQARERVRSMHVDAYAARVVGHLSNFIGRRGTRGNAVLRRRLLRCGLRAINSLPTF